MPFDKPKKHQLFDLSDEDSDSDDDLNKINDDEVMDDVPNEEKIEVIPAFEPSFTLPVEKRKTTPYMTKFEKARVLGTRASQIAMCAPVMVKLEGETDPLEIAMKELKARKINMVVRRYLPDGSFEDWAINELIIRDNL